MKNPYEHIILNKENNIEQEIPPEMVTIDVVRHGETAYKELNDPHFVFDPTQEGFELTSDYLDLTKEGIKNIKESAEELAKRIDSNNEIVLIVSSPNYRARSSALLIDSVLKEHNIQLLTEQPRTAHALKQIGFDESVDTAEWMRVASEYLGEFANDAKPTPDIAHPATAKRMGATSEEPLIENYDDIEMRFNNFLRHYSNIRSYLNTETLKTIGKKRMRIISVTHEDTVSRFLQQTIGEGTNIDKGQVVEIQPYNEQVHSGESMRATVELLPNGTDGNNNVKNTIERRYNVQS